MLRPRAPATATGTAQPQWDPSMPFPLPLTGKTREQLLAEEKEREQNRTWWRLRRHLYPWQAAAGLATAGAGTWAADLAGADNVWTAATTATAAAAIGAVAYTAAKSSIPKPWRGRLAAAGVFATGWLATAAAVGPSVAASWSLAAGLAAGTVTFGARWWRSLRFPYPTQPPAPAEPVEEVDESIPALWKANIAATDAALPGSWLFAGEDTTHGERYLIQLRPGKHTFTHVLAALPRISSGLGVDVASLVVEPEGPNTVRLEIVHDSPLAANPTLTAPAWDNGVVYLGPYADGNGEAPWRLWTPDLQSVWSGVIIGSTGIGKSRLMESLAISAMASGLVVTWFADPQGGGSSPTLQEHADWYVGLDGIPDMLNAIEGIVRFRQAENAALGVNGFTPSPDRPILLVFLDECQLTFRTQAQGKRWAAIMRICRKVGIGFVLISQYPGLETFGGSEPLRAQAMMGNVIAMYAPSRQNGSLMAGLEVDPLTLPRIPGYGFTSATFPGARLAPFRNRLAVDAADLMAAQPHLVLDPVAAKGAGPVYAARTRTAEERRAAARQELADLMAGTLTITATAGALPDRDEDGDLVAGLPVPTLPPVPPELTPPKSAPGPVPLRAVPTTCREAVLAALRDGPRRTADLETALDYSKSAIRKALTGLVESGRVTHPAHGTYALTTPAREAR